MTRPDSAGDELVDHLAEDGTVLGSTTRRMMRRGNLLHRAVFIIVTDGARVLMHQRADWKDIWPGWWDLAFGGIVAAGEHWDDAAGRELEEETGVEAPLELLGEARYDDDHVREISRVYRAVTSGPFTFPDGEVADSTWVPQADVEAWVANRDVCLDSLAIVLPWLR